MKRSCSTHLSTDFYNTHHSYVIDKQRPTSMHTHIHADTHTQTVSCVDKITYRALVYSSLHRVRADQHCIIAKATSSSGGKEMCCHISRGNWKMLKKLLCSLIKAFKLRSEAPKIHWYSLLVWLNDAGNRCYGWIPNVSWEAAAVLSHSTEASHWQLQLHLLTGWLFTDSTSPNSTWWFNQINFLSESPGSVIQTHV